MMDEYNDALPYPIVASKAPRLTDGMRILNDNYPGFPKTNQHILQVVP